jgi:hypothetical protein
MNRNPVWLDELSEGALAALKGATLNLRSIKRSLDARDYAVLVTRPEICMLSGSRDDIAYIHVDGRLVELRYKNRLRSDEGAIYIEAADIKVKTFKRCLPEAA